ncbi:MULTISPECIES: hypothetical protein [Pseudomonas]|uniref:hypothetical protein n=1 Tax=Pseudomonas TaxID=286 RepID=UPI000CD5AB5F|nr:MULTISPECIES: hypothetical protein [Pseudomonas]RBH52411.1 hypothetical protein C3F00_031950 [Pseudomonas sp. MWU13-2860]
MAAVSNSVVHLTMRFGLETLSVGTGVLYLRDEKYFIVTAWHNVTGLHTETLGYLSKNAAVPDNVVVSLAVKRGAYVSRWRVVLPIYTESSASFYIHPVNWPRIDVVAIPFDPCIHHDMELWHPDGNVEHCKIDLLHTVPAGEVAKLCPAQNYLPDRQMSQRWLDSVAITDELFIPGYPHDLKDIHGQPVWKRATIASSVQHGWDEQPKYLIDSASKSGMSGSPVFFYSPRGVLTMGGTTLNLMREIAILAGIYVGRVGIQGGNDPQIGTVWHPKVIDEIIDGQHYERLPHAIEVPSRELECAMAEVLKKIAPEVVQRLSDSNSPYWQMIINDVLSRLQGRVSLKRVRQEMCAQAGLPVD